MKSWTNLLLLPIVFCAINLSENSNKNLKNNNNLQPQKNQISECGMHGVDFEYDHNPLSVKLSSEPYRKESFATTFHYKSNARVIDYWSKNENVETKWNDKYLKEKGDIEVEAYCYKEIGSFTLYVMDENKKISNLSVYIRNTDFGIFTSDCSQLICDNKYNEYLYKIGKLGDYEMDKIYSEYITDKYNSPIVWPPFDQIRLTGSFTWADRWGKEHACSGLKYQLFDGERDKFLGLKIVKYEGFLDENGKCDVLLERSKIDLFNVEFVLLSEVEGITVGPFMSRDYALIWHPTPYNDSSFQIQYCMKARSIFEKSMVIPSVLYWGRKYANKVDKTCSGDATVIYPSAGCFDALHYVNIEENTYDSVDVVLHEYGHSLEESLGLVNYFNAFNLFKDHYMSVDPTTKQDEDKESQLQVVFLESLATTFSLRIQKTFPEYFDTIPLACDTTYDHYTWYEDYELEIPKYDGFNRRNYCIGTVPYYLEGRGEALEITTAALFYDLIDDSDDEYYDKVSLGDKGLWDILKRNYMFTFSDFSKALYREYMGNFNNLCDLLNYHGFGTNIVNIDNISSSGVTISWGISGNVKEPKSRTITDTYDLVIYNTNNQKLLEINDITDNSYRLQGREWKRITDSLDLYFKVVVGSKSAIGDYVSGPYYSPMKTFMKQGGYVAFDSSYLDGHGLTEMHTSTGQYSFGSSSFVSSVSWKNASLETNNKHETFISLNAGRASDHTSYVEFHTNETFSKISFNLVFYSNRSIQSTAEIGVYVDYGNGFVKVTNIDPNTINMDRNDCHYNFVMGGGCEMNNFKLVLTGYGYTALCITNIVFDTTKPGIIVFQDPWY